ncbi:hypothetical protein BDZ89DRAFT_1061258 [Hymenopellis radicata]|nr:hypothetical protein BDZ89DRAFT_1061258 [Hymenopellis radicata]
MQHVPRPASTWSREPSARLRVLYTAALPTIREALAFRTVEQWQELAFVDLEHTSTNLPDPLPPGVPPWLSERRLQTDAIDFIALRQTSQPSSLKSSPRSNQSTDRHATARKHLWRFLKGHSGQGITNTNGKVMCVLTGKGSVVKACHTIRQATPDATYVMCCRVIGGYFSLFSRLIFVPLQSTQHDEWDQNLFAVLVIDKDVLEAIHQFFVFLTSVESDPDARYVDWFSFARLYDPLLCQGRRCAICFLGLDEDTQEWNKGNKVAVRTFAHPLLLMLRLIDTLSAHGAPWADWTEALDIELEGEIKQWLMDKFGRYISQEQHIAQFVAFTAIAARFYTRFPRTPVWAPSTRHDDVPTLNSSMSAMTLDDHTFSSTPSGAEASGSGSRSGGTQGGGTHQPSGGNGSQRSSEGRDQDAMEAPGRTVSALSFAELSPAQKIAWEFWYANVKEPEEGAFPSLQSILSHSSSYLFSSPSPISPSIKPSASSSSTLGTNDLDTTNHPPLSIFVASSLPSSLGDVTKKPTTCDPRVIVSKRVDFCKDRCAYLPKSRQMAVQQAQTVTYGLGRVAHREHGVLARCWPERFPVITFGGVRLSEVSSTQRWGCNGGVQEHRAD